MVGNSKPQRATTRSPMDLSNHYPPTASISYKRQSTLRRERHQLRKTNTFRYHQRWTLRHTETICSLAQILTQYIYRIDTNRYGFGDLESTLVYLTAVLKRITPLSAVNLSYQGPPHQHSIPRSLKSEGPPAANSTRPARATNNLFACL